MLLGYYVLVADMAETDRLWQTVLAWWTEIEVLIEAPRVSCRVGEFQRSSQQWAYEWLDCSCARAWAGDFHPGVLRGRLLGSSWTCWRRSAEWTARLVPLGK